MPDREGSNPSPFLPFMTVCPGRRIETKVPKTLGQAKNAILGTYLKGTAALYKWEDGGFWGLLFEVKPNTPTDEMPWAKRKKQTYYRTQEVTTYRLLSVEATSEAEAEREYQHGHWSATDWSDARPRSSSTFGWTAQQ